MMFRAIVIANPAERANRTFKRNKKIKFRRGKYRTLTNYKRAI